MIWLIGIFIVVVIIVTALAILLWHPKVDVYDFIQKSLIIGLRKKKK